ncbi:MAG: DegT/DnrJ/EryC1/StrS family aminotransferase [Sedimentibacter sp.]
MQIEFNVLDRQYKEFEDEYNAAAIKVLKSGWYILGDEVENFEKQYANYIGKKYCVGLNSGLDALILAFRALNIGIGDEVIVPANTFIASVIGITENMATPVFVEPNEFYNIDVNKIEEKITKNTKAILVVHLYGQAANMKKIKELADKYNLFLIEDCAQSHGANYDGKKTGSWGDIGCFSFFPTKNLGAFGDAGAVVTDNVEIFEKLKMLRNYGSKIKYHNEIVGINSRLDEMQAALLNIKLKHIDELIIDRKRVAQRYLNEIKNENIILPNINSNSEHVWHLFVIRTKDRVNLKGYLSNNGITTLIHYPIPPHLSECYSNLGYHKGDFPLTEKYSEEVLSLPLYNSMTDEEIDYVINVINNWNKK